MIVAMVVYFYLDKTLVNQKLKEIVRLNIEQVHETNQIFEKNQVFSKMLGTRTRVIEYLATPTEAKRKELLGIFSEYTKDDNKYLSLYLLDKKGIAVISTDPSFIGQDYSFRDYYKEGLLGKQSVDLLLGKTSNQFGYYFSYPVFNNKKDVLGVFVAKINNKEIDEAIASSEVSKESTLMLVDKFGIVVASNKPERFLTSLGQLTSSEKKLILESKKYLNSNITSLQYNSAQEAIRENKYSTEINFKDAVDGETEIININKVNDLPFYLVSETGLETVGSTVLNIIFLLLIFMILSIVFFSIIIYRLILVVISPLKELKMFAEKISEGNFSKRININSKDEFSDLSQAFNKMADDLENLYHRLENKVEERTKDLLGSEAALKKALDQSERINKLMVGRELEMIKLKKRIIEIENNNHNEK